MSIVEIFSPQKKQPIGIRLGSLVRGYLIDGKDPFTGEYPDDITNQSYNLLKNLKFSLESCGGSLDNVAQVSLRFNNVATDLPHFNNVWTEFFPNPDDRPTYKFMADTLEDGKCIESEYYAVLAPGRKSIQIDGVAHTNPIPMATQIGSYLFSSRVLPFDSSTGRESESAEIQWKNVVENVSAVLDKANMEWADITQGRLFIQDVNLASIIDKSWNAIFHQSTSPPLHIQPYVGAPTLKVMLEIIASKNRS